MDQEIDTLAQQSNELLGQFASFTWEVSVIIAIAGLLVAKLAELFILGVVVKLMARTDNKLDDKLVGMLRKPLFNTFALFGLMIASKSSADLLGENALLVTLAILKTLIIFSWLRFLLRSSGAVLHSMGANKQHFSFAQKDTVPLLRNLATVFLVLAGAYSILVAWDIDVTGLVASAGIVGLALSFAAQDTLSHLFAGVAILADRPYRIGDYIVLDSGERGMVTHIGLRSTRLMTRDDVEVSIPNGVMGSATIVNESGGGDTRYRVRAQVGAAYGSDVDHVLKVLEQVALDNQHLCKEPKPRVRFRKFGDSSLDFDLLVWVAEPSLRGVRIHELNCEIYRRFTEEGIAIPFPQQDVWIKELPANYKSQPGNSATSEN
jgi:MscS family membrane protein